MGNLNVSRNVYDAVTRATRDGQVTPQEMQNIVQEVNGDHTVSRDEQRMLENMRSGTAFTLRTGNQQTPIEPAQLTFPSQSNASSHTGHRIGTTASGQAIHLGALKQSFVSEHDAQQYARSQWGVSDDPDLAIVQGTDGRYNVYNLEIPGRLSRDASDLSSYGQIRSSRFNTMPTGTALTGIYSDNNDFRAYSREAAPTRRYAPIQDPHPGDTVQTLRAKASQVADRLSDMRDQLGPQQDHRGIFAAMYSVITDRGIAEMDRFIAEGNTAAADFEGRLLVNFANKYFEAYDNYTSGNLNNVPEVWRSAFDSGRNAEAAGYPKASVTEVTALSMVAHIIHDLPLTLQEIGYQPGGVQEEVYDHFNVALMEEKNNIMGAIAQHYGRTDLHLLEGAFSAGMGAVGGTLGSLPIGLSPAGRQIGSAGGRRAAAAVQQEMFTQMRNMAKNQAAQGLSQPQIQRNALRFSDAARVLIPGGN